jgi:hypothetical protein
VTMTPDTASLYVPEGFVTSNLTTTLDGPIYVKDGRYGYGPRTYYWGLQHIYDDGTLRIVVRPGNHETYSAPGYYMEIQPLAGRPGQQFSNVHAALSAARDEVLRQLHGRASRLPA